MKFKLGSDVDIEHCKALTHEYLKCDDAFNEFHTFASMPILQGGNRWVSYKTYSAYSNFIQHLYEFMTACLARENGHTKISNNSDERHSLVENYINNHIQRILNKNRQAILNGTAASWENDFSNYPEKVPENFAKDFRNYRNKVGGHVAYERVSKLSLSDFYVKYHKYLYLLYQDSKNWWGLRNKEFPDLKEITDFSVVIFRELQ